MAPQFTLLPIYIGLFVSASLIALASSTAEEFLCEQLPVENCAFAVSMSGERCVLETNILKDGTVQLECQTSEIVTEKFRSWIEDTECIEGCGLNRMSIGLSSDFLGEHELQRGICAPSCFQRCANIVELFTKLASGEGVGLQNLCQAYVQDVNVAPRKLIQDSTTWVAATSDATTSSFLSSSSNAAASSSDVAQSPKAPSSQ